MDSNITSGNRQQSLKQNPSKSWTLNDRAIHKLLTLYQSPVSHSLHLDSWHLFRPIGFVRMSHLLSSPWHQTRRVISAFLHEPLHYQKCKTKVKKDQRRHCSKNNFAVETLDYWTLINLLYSKDPSSSWDIRLYNAHAQPVFCFGRNQVHFPRCMWQNASAFHWDIYVE